MDFNFQDFKSEWQLSRQDICRDIFENHREHIQVKKEAIAIRNLANIVDATLYLANKKGFQAMSLRDLSAEAGLSMGALYAYFRGKEDLVAMLQATGRRVTQRVLSTSVKQEERPYPRLVRSLRTHLYLSEVLQPWFYFTFMEAKHLPRAERQRAVEAERWSERLFLDILEAGQDEGCFREIDNRMLAAMIKALLQDWYLKRGKYRERNIPVDTYAHQVQALIESYLLTGSA